MSFVVTPLLSEGQPFYPGAAGNPAHSPHRASERSPGFSVGDRVVVKRDETLYPPKGTWARFRGKTGTVETINPDPKHPNLTEYAVALKGDGLTWFKASELVPA
jgi:hypothetical protein